VAAVVYCEGREGQNNSIQQALGFDLPVRVTRANASVFL